MLEFTISAMRSRDWEQVSAIYREGMAAGNATFEKNIPDWEKWDSGHLK